MTPRELTFRAMLVAVVLVSRGYGQAPSNIGDVPDGNRAVPVHLIKLYDEFDHVIRLGETPVMPFSTKQTCRKCHEYERIAGGWHFNAADSVHHGRAGEPWIMVDKLAATQIPLSYRGWTGTYHPEAVGLTTFGFLGVFGRHLPGGGVGENDRLQDLDDYMRWQVSGTLEINCQSCHNGDPAHNQAEYGVQVLRQNFRWAAAAASGFATVQGSALEMPDNYDLYSVVPPERSGVLPPTVTYSAARFDVANRVLFDVPRRMSQTQCAFCHSAKVVDPSVSERWEGDEDVHIAAGMECVDCHRNGVDHRMIRGYAREAAETGRPAAASFTCAGCHIGVDGAEVPMEGRRGAPRPQHLGIPPVHFEKLACTACHSGPWPRESTYFAKTSRAHALGIPKADKADSALPHVATPVFAMQEDGTYAPHNLLWPAFWASETPEGFIPIAPARVSPLVKEVLERDTNRVVGKWPVLTDAEIIQVLAGLAGPDSVAARVAYVTGGKVCTVGEDGVLEWREEEAAKPYLWPIAHDVRPKTRSLGIRGCSDCHATDAPFHFGSVAVASPFAAVEASHRVMTEYQETNRVSAWLFSMSFLFRPGLKAVIILCFVLVSAVVLISAGRGLGHLIRMLAAGDE
ncbi:MAG: hypothetical protein H6Q29_1035 [Bacteroidetes bacterium]|nr:hypothetical protein [Bacteroidota bacterium]